MHDTVSTTPTISRPLVGIVCCARRIGDHDFHVVADKYVRAVAEGAQALPFLVPALGDDLDLEAVLARVDGLLFTGSPSNVEPWRYGGPDSASGTRHDPARDAVTLRLISRAVNRGTPLLGICRGVQEINVALGGTLHQRLHEVPGRMMHQADDRKPVEQRFGPAHPVRLTEGGMLHRIVGTRELVVNSVHSQGIDTLAPGLAVEAVSPDGQIEAVSIPASRSFSIGVQWHPEWCFADRPGSQAIFTAFADAVRQHAVQPRRPMDDPVHGGWSGI